jgi:uncharacterized protein YdbL (DUF1318 family)
MTQLRRRIALLTLVACCLFGGAPARADSLDDAKAKGLVGERIDGYVGAVGTDGESQALVEEVNAARRARYGDIAAKRGALIEAVAQIAGKKLIERAGPGHYVMGADGEWTRK